MCNASICLRRIRHNQRHGILRWIEKWREPKIKQHAASTVPLSHYFSQTTANGDNRFYCYFRWRALGLFTVKFFVKRFGRTAIASDVHVSRCKCVWVCGLFFEWALMWMCVAVCMITLTITIIIIIHMNIMKLSLLLCALLSLAQHWLQRRHRTIGDGTHQVLPLCWRASIFCARWVLLSFALKLLSTSHIHLLAAAQGTRRRLKSHFFSFH